MTFTSTVETRAFHVKGSELEDCQVSGDTRLKMIACVTKWIMQWNLIFALASAMETE